MVTRESAIEKVILFIKECQSNGLTFQKVLLFGSAAKDMTHEWSDIDLLLVSDQFNENIFDNLKLYSKINLKYPEIETHPYSSSYYNSGDAFIEKISKEGIEIA